MHPNLFFAGEMLDIDGLCGGYNISFAAISAKVISDCLLKKIV
jgi:predicted flavoprotein YhiN